MRNLLELTMAHECTMDNNRGKSEKFWDSLTKEETEEFMSFCDLQWMNRGMYRRDH